MDFSTLMQQASANQQYTEKKVNIVVNSVVYIHVFILVTPFLGIFVSPAVNKIFNCQMLNIYCIFNSITTCTQYSNVNVLCHIEMMSLLCNLYSMMK